MRNSTRSRSPVRLHLHQLETRDTPAGTVNATFSAGLLTLTGDDDSNSVQLMQTGTNITVVGFNSTTIVGGPNFNNVTSVKTVMKGGNDEILSNPIGPFSLAGAANFDLGDGNNTLGLSTAGVVSLGSLTVKAGDGDDSITVSGIAGSEVTGNVVFDLKAGDTDIHLNNLEINGIGGLKFNATDGADSLNLLGVQLSKAATVSTGLGQLEAVINGGTLGSISLTGTGVNPMLSFDGVELVMNATNVTGAIKVTSQTGARVDLAGVSAASLSITGGRFGGVDVTASGGTVNFTTGGITVRGGVSNLFVSPGITLDAAGDIALLATDGNFVQVNSGQLIARNVRLTSSQGAAALGSAFIVTGSGNAAVDADIILTGRATDCVIIGSAVTARNLKLTGSSSATHLQNGVPTAILNLTGAMTLRAPFAQIDLLVGSLSATGNVSVSASAVVGLNAASGTTLDVGGTLSLNAGSGEANIQFDGALLQVDRDLTVKGAQSGALSITPSAVSTIARHATFTLGTDDDVLTVNSNVAVQGNLTVNAGAGNNSVTLGTTAANFAVGGNLVVTALGGDELITLNRPVVTGTTRVTTGAGADLLQMNGPATFTGAVTIDLGAGDDTWNAANDTGTTSGPVTFTGTVSAKLGAGNDTLRLGLSLASGGNLNTRVNFTDSLSNKIDGGSGLNFYDDEAAQFGGTVAIVNVTDPTP